MDHRENDKKGLDSYYANIKMRDINEHENKLEDEIIKNTAIDCKDYERDLEKNDAGAYIINYDYYSYVYDGVVVQLNKYDSNNVDNVSYINLLAYEVLKRVFGYSFFLPTSVVDEHNKVVSGSKRR